MPFELIEFTDGPEDELTPDLSPEQFRAMIGGEIKEQLVALVQSAVEQGITAATGRVF